MKKVITTYLEELKKSVKTNISDLLTKEKTQEIAREAFKDYYNYAFSAFHKYYSETISNRDLFFIRH